MVAVVTMSDENRDDLIACCKGVADMIDWLDSLNSRPGLAELGVRLESMPLNLEALKEHIVYTEDNGYQRNIIKKTEHYEMVAITWRSGQATPIHDHTGSDCATSAVRDYAPGEVCAAEEPDIHRISNDTDGNLINLHVYTPPLSGFGIYEAA